jgi:shikimate kinase/3-dehydroquinate synthase
MKFRAARVRFAPMTRPQHSGAVLPASQAPSDERALAVRAALNDRAIVLVGMMGSGKSAIGQRLAARLGLPFVDADAEIVAAAAGMSIPEIFAKYGERYFRDGERRVIMRLLNGGPVVLATGGGAFLDPRTRDRIAERGVSVWLDADLKTLLKRVRRKNDRPLLQTEDPEETLRQLLEARRPLYELADLRVESREIPQDAMVDDTLAVLAAGLPILEDLRQRAQSRGFAKAMTHLYPARAEGDARRQEIVRVALGGRSYDIIIGDGLLQRAGDYIAEIAPGAACAIITDENVARLHLPTVEQSLKDAGLRATTIIVPPGEASKSLSVYGRVCDDVLAARIERRDLIVALGGGVVGDLAGFVAASVRRGSRFVQIPTTLLSQVDSSVGGKTGINSRHGKNLIGAFHQPALVLADVDSLRTLPLREFRAGYAEVVKYGLIGDARFFDWLDADSDAVFHSQAEQICAVAVSCETKATIVARDETEQGERALLNLGHTFGHAFERLTGYDSARLVHGEGVAIGMACAARFSVRRGLCPEAAAERVERHLKGVGLPTRIHDIPGWRDDAQAILDAMYQDKKVERGALTFILLRGIGQAFIAKSVDANEVLGFLKDELKRT